MKRRKRLSAEEALLREMLVNDASDGDQHGDNHSPPLTAYQVWEGMWTAIKEKQQETDPRLSDDLRDFIERNLASALRPPGGQGAGPPRSPGAGAVGGRPSQTPLHTPLLSGREGMNPASPSGGDSSLPHRGRVG